MIKNRFTALSLSFIISLQCYFFNASAQNSLDYDGSNDFVSLPSGLVNTLNADYTIEVWVYWRGASTSNWQRIFDFGTGTSFNMFLTPCNGETGTPRFAITQTSDPGEERITAPSALSLNAWHHIAVVVTNATNTGNLFIDGSLVATNTSMSLRPSSLGVTTLNYFGRSQYGPDPYFNGYIDEVRISNNIRYTSTFTPQGSDFSADANTIALYHFDEASGQAVNDETGNFTGTLGATASSETSDPGRTAFTSLPVGLGALAASAHNDAVELNWTTFFEQNNKGFHVERSGNGVNFSPITFLNGSLHSDIPIRYSYADHTAPAGLSWYRLKQEDVDGRFNYSNICKVTVNAGNAKLSWRPINRRAIEARLSGGKNELYQLAGMNGQTIQTGSLSNGRVMLSLPSQGSYILSIISKGQKFSAIVVL